MTAAVPPAAAPAASPPALPQGAFAGREAFAQAVRDALACAAREGWRELVLSDADFIDWPLGEPAVVESLNAWAHQHGRLTMLARSYDEIVRRHPRFVRWRTTWDHRITCRRSPQADALDIPSVLWSPGWVLHRLNPPRCTGVAGAEPERRVALQQDLQEWLQRKSTPGFAATTLGL